MFKDFSIVIAAGGLGTRLSDFRGEDTNKVLLEINGVPMIIQQINQLQEWGLDISKIICITNPCLLYTSPSPRDRQKSRMPSSA